MELLSFEDFCRRYGFKWDSTGMVDMTKALEAYIAYCLNPKRYGVTDSATEGTK